MNDVERAYRLHERRREVPLETRVFRGKVGVLLALQLSLLLGAVTFAVDLRRLQTPLGAAQAWSEAVVFGDCARARELSVAAPGALAGALSCRALDSPLPEDLGRLQVTTRLVEQARDRASVVATVRDGEQTTSAVLPLVREDGAWYVVRTPQACEVGC